MDLNNKTILFLGSSITYGYGSNGISFVDLLTEEYNLKSYKEAVNGTTLVDIDDNSYISRLKKIAKDIHFDLVVLQLSTNDAAKDLNLRDIKEAIIYIIEYVKNNFNCPLVIYTNPKYNSEKYYEMVNLVNELQEDYKFYLLDLYNDDRVNLLTNMNNDYMVDNIHPSFKGYKELWVPLFKKIIDKI